ncbi:MAG TPA: hypothetical protein VLX28_17860 [Thermoanaerobaculia bacterium]|nr:hypothetical protein [Thermoanaerobaculia bacterium]
MTLPGFTAGAVMPAAIAQPVLFPDDPGLDLGGDPGGDLVGTCAATTSCGNCIRICPRPFFCTSFRICHCTSHNGVRRTFTQPC